MAYNPDGLRLRKEDSAGASAFLWDGQNILLETNSGSDVYSTSRPDQFGKLLSRGSGVSARYYHLDALDSATPVDGQ